MDRLPLRILVVDEDEVDRLAVRRCLQQSGVQTTVDQATSASEALERIEAAGYDCLLLDFYLPGVNGLALLQAIRDRAPEMPIVMFTGRGDEEIAVELMKAGAVDYLPKASLTPERMASSLRHAMELAGTAAAQRRAEEERNRLFAAEQATRMEAELAIQTRDAVLSVVSHDLQNPLMAIKGQVQLLQRRVSHGEQLDSDAVLAGLRGIDSNATRMSVLIRGLMDVVRLRAGQQLELLRQPTDLAALARQVIATYQQTTGQHQIICTGVETGPVGNWDSDRLERVLGNLLTNAIKYSPDGGEIQVDVRQEGDQAVLAVQDHGVGIPTADLPHIFDSYYRASNVAEFAGTGLGLSGAREVLELQGGTITVTSTEGVGSRFVVRMPLAGADDGDMRIRAAEAK